MAITVNPPMPNQVTGEMEGDFQVIDSGGVSAEANTVTTAEETDLAFDPDFQRAPQLKDRAFFSDNPRDLQNFWRSNTPLTDDEISQIQDTYIESGNEQTPRLLNYKMTGDTTDLFPEDFEYLGITDSEPDPNYLSNDQIDQSILTDADEPSAQMANAVLSADIGDSNAATIVQHLTHQYYAGQISAQEAFYKAGNSGINQNELYDAFRQLTSAVSSRR